jgi:UDP-N-acetylglucosamine 1-carboxyvinyltransferase
MTMRKLLDHLGVGGEEEGDSLRLVATDRASSDDAPYELVKTMRASILVLGPLVARLGHARVSLPGGCAIGVRPIDQHLACLEALGAETTVLENCAREPEVVDLAKLLTGMGAHIDGAGDETVVIEGVDRLAGTRHTVIPDRIEGGTYLIGAAITGGDILLEGADAADLAPLLEKLAETGCEIQDLPAGIRLRQQGELKPRDTVTAPHPGFPTDLQAQYMALMTQAQGGSTICETIFENRFQHVSELTRMGADIQVEGSYARIHGPSRLSSASVMATDLRASACLVLAGLVAHGETLVDRIYHLDRGYERMELKLQKLGARVERLGNGG